MSIPADRMVGFGDSLGLFFKNYAQFNGRSSRGAYWYLTLWMMVLGFIAAVVDFAFFNDLFQASEGSGPLQLVVGLGTLIPSIAISVRRLHDTGHSGWWLLIMFTVIGILLLLWWYCQPGKRADNKYGPDREAGR